MITTTEETRTHAYEFALEFEREFSQEFANLFHRIAMYASREGVKNCGAFGNSVTAKDPEDFAQDCLAEYLRVAHAANHGSIESKLLWHIVKLRIIDMRRAKSQVPHERRLIDDLGTIAETDSTPTPECYCTAKLLNCLSEKEKDILVLKHVCHGSNKSVATHMEMTVDGIRSAEKRAKRKVRLARNGDPTQRKS